MADGASGLPLLRLPPGFRYLSFGWRGEAMDDGIATPDRHDGMAVAGAEGNRVTLVRNHEIFTDKGCFGAPEHAYDRRGGGGTTTLVFDAARERLAASRASLWGTFANCAGGPTPWGAWLSCEEVPVSPAQFSRGREWQVHKPHGFVFEVPCDGRSDARPLEAIGRFAHEAVAVDPATGIVYQTEDRDPEAGFYRFVPEQAGELARGGRLQMMAVKAREQMVTGLPAEQPFDVQWVDIDDPTRIESPDGQHGAGVISQGLAGGATPFRRLEGCWEEAGVIYFTSTSGGDAGFGQVFAYEPASETIRLVYESPGGRIVNHPDNLTVSPHGGLVLCEDGTRDGQMLIGLTEAGEPYPLAENNIRLDGEPHGLSGDFRRGEWCGACFSPNGKWLFVNIQKPGVTFAITGPWERLGRS